MKTYKELISGLFFAVLGAAVYGYSFTITLTNIGGRYGSRLVPQIIGVLMVFLGIIVALRDIKPMVQRHIHKDTTPMEAGATEPTDSRTVRRILSIFIVSFMYVGLLRLLGFVVATPLYLFVMMILLTPNDVRIRYVLYAVVSMIVMLSSFLLFRYAFLMILPRGTLF